MSIENTLSARSNNQCELCSSHECLSVYNIPPAVEFSPDKSLLLCEVCTQQVKGNEPLDINHWRCLNESMWNQEQAIQIMAWRMLKQLEAESWAQDLLDIFYLDDKVLAAAKEGFVIDEQSQSTRDANGTVLQTGDNVTLVKDLDVKGAGFTAKRGTVVKNISLTDNPEQIEGRINGIQLVLVSKFMKKVN